MSRSIQSHKSHTPQVRSIVRPVQHTAGRPSHKNYDHEGEDVNNGVLGKIIARAVKDIRDDEEVINLVTTLIWMHQQDRHGWEIIEHESA